MSAGMAAKVQAKTYFHSSMMDLNNGLFNVMWDPYHDNRNQGYNSFMMSQNMDGYPGYPKEQMRQTILKQESIFRHQLQELHRVYKRQRDLMNEIRMKECYGYTIPAKAPNSGHFLNQACSQRRVIDLELPADVEDDNEENQPVKNVNCLSTKRAFNLADLNEPIQMEEASSAACFITTKNSDRQNLSTNSQFWYSQAAPNKANEHLSKRKTLFGVEISESRSWDQNASSHAVSNGIKNLETQLPHWLTQTKGKEAAPYQMNLDSLQQHSQQFFKKSEKLLTENSHGITKILGVPVPVQDSTVHDTNAEIDKNNRVSESRHVIDLNMSFDEEEEEDLSATPNVPETVVNIASTEIDLETPVALEPESDADDQELVKSAAEAIVSISSSGPPTAGTLLMWFAEVIESDDCINIDIKDSIPEGMDEFEYMTLNLEETEVDNLCYKPVTVTENEENGDGLSRKPAIKKGVGKRGRQRKDFQRDVLPGIVTLSRREVTEDLQTFEEAFNGIGVSWQSKRKGGRGRRQTVALSPPRPEQESVCREVVALEEKSLSGWGKRTRRLPRQRCQNGGNHQSLALKC